MYQLIYKITAACLLISSVALAQNLPPHKSINILIVSDEVNPHNLTDEDLMQPGDLSNALSNASTLNASSITEIPTNDIEHVTGLLNSSVGTVVRPDVLIYFAHRIPDNGNNDSGRQAEFVTATEQFLQTGGGVVVFHHGIYRTAGKQDMQALLGSEAVGNVPWDTVNGQDVIFVGNDHFIGSHQISYSGNISYENPSHNISLNNYPYFNNSPDERYPQMEYLPVANSGCEIENLFQTNYDVNGNQHLLAYTKQCPNWLSKVVVYQPGEYQPNATSGNNFQILLNAIYYVSNYHWDIIFTDGFEGQ